MRTAVVVVAYAVALAFGLYQTFRPTIDSRFALVQTERGDGMLNHYILEHTWQSVSNPSYRGSLFSPPFYYPEPHVLWYSEHFLGVAPLYWALRLVAAHDFAYQWWQIILAAGNFVAFAWVARRLGCPHLLAILGGYLWAFGLVHIDQIKHQQMIARFWMPLAAYATWSFALEPAVRSLNRMFAFTFLQCLACVYTGWFLATGLAVFLPVAILLVPGSCRRLWRFLKEHPGRTALVVLGWSAIHVASFVPYMVINADQERTYKDCNGLMPSPSAWITGLPGTPWYETTEPIRDPVGGECGLFCGFGIYALVLVASVHLVLVRWRARRPKFGAVAAAIITAIVWVLLTLTVEEEGRSLWEIVRYVPGATALRCVTRVYVTVYLFGTLAALVWLARVTDSLRPPVRFALLGLIALALIYEQTGYRPPSFEKPDFYGLVDRTAGEVRGAEALYVHRAFTDTKGFTSTGVYAEVFAMWVGLRANVPVVNGYSGRAPAGAYPWLTDPTDDDLRKWFAGRFRGKLTILKPDNLPAKRVIVGE
jgi:hypothetical protein